MNCLLMTWNRGLAAVWMIHSVADLFRSSFAPVPSFGSDPISPCTYPQSCVRGTAAPSLLRGNVCASSSSRPCCADRVGWWCAAPSLLCPGSQPCSAHMRAVLSVPTPNTAISCSSNECGSLFPAQQDFFGCRAPSRSSCAVLLAWSPCQCQRRLVWKLLRGLRVWQLTVKPFRRALTISGKSIRKVRGSVFWTICFFNLKWNVEITELSEDVAHRVGFDTSWFCAA